jgi:signal transduction histidine kinase
MTSAALLGRIELLHTLLAAARRLTATERACLWHGGLAHGLGEGALELADAARRACAEGELVERVGDTVVAAVPLPGRTGGLAVGAAADEGTMQPRRVALLGRLAGQGGAELAGWASDRPFWEGLLPAPAAAGLPMGGRSSERGGGAAGDVGAVSTRGEAVTTLVVGDGPSIELEAGGWRAVQRLEAEIVDDAAHELRSPLTAVRAHAEIMPDMLTDADETARQFLGVIDAEAQRMGWLLDELRAVLTFETTVVEHR